MTKIESSLKEKIEKREKFFIVEIHPPKHGNPQALRKTVNQYKGRAVALGISDNRSEVGMSALATASIVISEKMEPILHMITRDRNRIALISDILGAQALGIANLLITSGEHQTLGKYKNAKRVFDIDSIQLLKSVTNLSTDAGFIGEKNILMNPMYLGATADPYADPVDLQIMRLNKKAAAGTSFVITKPVFDLNRFNIWFEKVRSSGMENKIAIIAGIQILKNAEHANQLAKSRPNPMIPEELLMRIGSKNKEAEQQKEGINIALEIIQKLSELNCISGFCISYDEDHDNIIEIIEKSGLGER